MGFVTIIPIEDTFFRLIEKPRNTRLTKQVIRFNYAHLSPFQKGDTLFLQTSDSIYAWFLAKQLPAKTSIFIPEAYLVYRFFKAKQEAIIVLPRNNDLNILTIKNGSLLSVITAKNTVNFEMSLDLLRREHSLANPELIRLDPAAKFPFKLSDVLLFADFDVSVSELLGKSVNLAKVPIAVSLAISAAFTLYSEHRQEKIIETKRNYLSRLKKQNYELQTSLEQVRGKSDLWKEFNSKELVYPNFYLLLSKVSDVVVKFNGYINSVDLSDNHISLWTGQKTSEATLIKELLSSGLFSEVKLISSIKDSNMPDYTLLHLDMVLKPVSASVQP